MNYPNLFSPITLKGVTFPNRIMRTSMVSGHNLTPKSVTSNSVSLILLARKGEMAPSGHTRYEEHNMDNMAFRCLSGYNSMSILWLFIKVASHLGQQGTYSKKHRQ